MPFKSLLHYQKEPEMFDFEYDTVQIMDFIRDTHL